MAQILYTEEDIKTILKCNLYIFSKSEKAFIIFFTTTFKQDDTLKSVYD